MSAAEFFEWQVFNSISPIGDERTHDLGHARTQQLLYRVNGGKGNYELSDFMPFLFKPKLDNDMDNAIIDWARKLGAN